MTIKNNCEGCTSHIKKDTSFIQNEISSARKFWAGKNKAFCKFLGINGTVSSICTGRDSTGRDSGEERMMNKKLNDLSSLTFDDFSYNNCYTIKPITKKSSKTNFLTSAYSPEDNSP